MSRTIQSLYYKNAFTLKISKQLKKKLNIYYYEMIENVKYIKVILFREITYF